MCYNIKSSDLMPSFMSDFAEQLLTWFDHYGRKNLPWQKPITPYRVWVSEIMLQQTQVDTVIPYFTRFMQRFPTLQTLAEAAQDEVLHLWTGLGYYARARNLHACAQRIIQAHNGRFPADIDTLETLPGIGRSTAAAIASIAFEQPTAILDGNVKRVLARYHAIDGWPGETAVAKTLWQHAESHMPTSRCRDYTQAIMDLGATLCTRSRPVCTLCPLQKGCTANHQGNPQDYPGKKPRKQLPVKALRMLILQHESQVLLQQRPPTGIWGGLWSFPELAMEDDAESKIRRDFGDIATSEQWATVRHTFSHYHLDIAPFVATLIKPQAKISDNGGTIWYNLQQPPKLGLAAPVKKLIDQLE